MYINPFIAGVLATIITEFIVLFSVAMFMSKRGGK